MKRLDQKLARIRAGKYKPTDFIIADAKDGDMGPSLTSSGPKRDKDGNWTRYRTRGEFLDEIAAIVKQDIVDVMLVSASNLELLNERKVFQKSAVQPAIRANDTTCIWRMRGAGYHHSPSRPFRSASLPRVMYGATRAPGNSPASRRIKGTDLGLYSMTFNNDIEADIRSLEAFAAFRAEASALGFRYFLEVFNPNVDTRIDPNVLPHYINDAILRALAGVMKADRPQFLKIAYNGPKALEELASFDPSLVVGVLGGGAGTTRDAFELIHQAERYGARVALFGRKINLAESPLEMVAMLRRVAIGDVKPKEAVKAYHATLKKLGIKPARALEEDSAVTESVLEEAAA
ncbi:MAG TPA: hypothetical protein VMT54_17570 [Candidatus Cybelea sp.]|nr:hypothetical protein [Candidatus Cybelea sp.]